MRLLALDLGDRMGVAIGAPNERPVAYAVILKRADQAQAVAFGNLMLWLQVTFDDPARRPGIVVKEGMIPLAGLRRLNSAEATVRMHAGLHAVVEAMCFAAGVRCHDVNLDRARKHFIGKRNAGSREETKRAVLQRCVQLGYLERQHRNDDDRGDALACWDWGIATLLRVPPKVLHMFGGS